MNGKDTHVRGLRALGVRECVVLIPRPIRVLLMVHDVYRPALRDDDLLPFTSQAFAMHERIR